MFTGGSFLRIIYLVLLGLTMAGTIPAGTISLTGSSPDLVAFNGVKNSITVGESCPAGTCTYTGTDGILTWQFVTPNYVPSVSPQTPNITWDIFEDVFGPTGGTFSVTDGSDSLNGTYAFSQWSYDGTPDSSGIDGIDLY